MTVFVLGAGASKFAGYPLALELWSFVRESSYHEVSADRRRDDAVAAIQRVMEVFPPEEHDRPDLEALFTLLDLTDSNVHHFELASFSWSEIRLKLLGAIADAFQWHEYLLQRTIVHGESNSAQPTVDTSRAQRILGAWCSRVKPGDVLLTFNWDLLHEAALWRAGKWHYSGGYGFPIADGSGPLSSPTTVLKLHGSVNWAQETEDDSAPEIEHKATFFQGAADGPGTYLKGAGEWSMGRRLIIPSYLKDISPNVLLLEIWNGAADALVAADEWVVIGHHLNPADAAARQLFGQALRRRRGRRTSVSIVAPGASPHWPSFATKLGAEMTRIRQTFEEWVVNSAQCH